MKRRLAGFLLVLALPLAGCGYFRENIFWPSLAAQPYTVISGAPVRLEPGWGVEANLTMQVVETNWLLYGHLARFACSHHESAPGRPEAVYVRLGTAGGITVSTDGSNDPVVGVGLLVGAGYYQLLVDGPGDRGGPGLSLEPEFWLVFRRRCRLSVGCSFDGWVSMDGDLIGSLSPFLRFGFSF